MVVCDLFSTMLNMSYKSGAVVCVGGRGWLFLFCPC